MVCLICCRKKVVREKDDFGINWDLYVFVVWLRLIVNLGWVEGWLFVLIWD